MKAIVSRIEANRGNQALAELFSCTFGLIDEAQEKENMAGSI